MGEKWQRKRREGDEWRVIAVEQIIVLEGTRGVGGWDVVVEKVVQPWSVGC